MFTLSSACDDENVIFPTRTRAGEKKTGNFPPPTRRATSQFLPLFTPWNVFMLGLCIYLCWVFLFSVVWDSIQCERREVCSRTFLLVGFYRFFPAMRYVFRFSRKIVMDFLRGTFFFALHDDDEALWVVFGTFSILFVFFCSTFFYRRRLSFGRFPLKTRSWLKRHVLLQESCSEMLHGRRKAPNESWDDDFVVLRKFDLAGGRGKMNLDFIQSNVVTLTSSLDVDMRLIPCGVSTENINWASSLKILLLDQQNLFTSLVKIKYLHK